MDNYEDIINIEHFEPRHKRMSTQARAAQFGAFAALSGYEESIKETARITGKRIEKTEDILNDINNKLLEIDRLIKNKPLIEVTYFIEDKYKDGGEYVIKEERIKTIDLVNHRMKFIDNKVIDINDIIYIKICDKNNEITS